jgi:hypothetical protein
VAASPFISVPFYFGRVPDIVEEDEALDLPAPRWLTSRQAGPLAVALLGSAAVVAGAQGFAKAVKELRLLLLGGGFRSLGGR